MIQLQPSQQTPEGGGRKQRHQEDQCSTVSGQYHDEWGQEAPGFCSGETNAFISNLLRFPSFERKTNKQKKPKKAKTPGWHGNLVKILVCP